MAEKQAIPKCKFFLPDKGLSIFVLALLANLSLSHPGAVRAQESSSLVIPRWSVAEFELEYNGKPDNPFQQVEAEGEFIPPDGSPAIKVEGFYDGGGIWRFRFVPRVYGSWSYNLRLKKGEKAVGVRLGSFVCRGDQGQGFLRVSAANSYRFEREDGTPFYPIGIQVCGQKDADLDGPAEGEGKWRIVSMETFLDAHRGGANLFRVQLGVGTRAGCAREIVTDSGGPYRYNLSALAQLDETCRLLKKYGFAVILIPFQDMSLWGTDSTTFGTNKDTEGWKNIHNREAVEPARCYLRYLVARYAAYTDIWELFNEDSYTPDEWLREMAAYVRNLDPYRHLVTTNYERPLERWCELVTPHEYMWMPANEIDAHLAKEFARLKSFGKPVLYTEFGNQGDFSNRDPLKWRLAVWTAFMNESAILFWSMSGIILAEKEGRRGNANTYLGPEDREYFRIFQSFVRDLPVTMRPVMLGYGEKGDELRRYALSDGRLSVLYLHHYTSHESSASGTIYLWTGPGEFEITWIDPASGATVGSDKATSTGHVLIFRCPPVTIDLAAKIKKID